MIISNIQDSIFFSVKFILGVKKHRAFSTIRMRLPDVR